MLSKDIKERMINLVEETIELNKIYAEKQHEVDEQSYCEKRKLDIKNTAGILDDDYIREVVEDLSIVVDYITYYMEHLKKQYSGVRNIDIATINLETTLLWLQKEIKEIQKN